jgi:hypothetical protein
MAQQAAFDGRYKTATSCQENENMAMAITPVPYSAMSINTGTRRPVLRRTVLHRIAQRCCITPVAFLLLLRRAPERSSI